GAPPLATELPDAPPLEPALGSAAGTSPPMGMGMGVLPVAPAPPAMAPSGLFGLPLPLPLALALPVGASSVLPKSTTFVPSLDPRGVSTMPGLSSPPLLGWAPDSPAPEGLPEATATCLSSTEQALAQLAASIRI